jgi:hypothetical protein
MPTRPPKGPFLGREGYVFMFLCKKSVSVDTALYSQQEYYLFCRVIRYRVPSSYAALKKSKLNSFHVDIEHRNDGNVSIA